MKTLKTLIVITIAIFGFSATSFGQTNSVTGSSSATVKATLTIKETAQLNFGTFGAKADAGSTVILATDGSRTGTADFIGNDGVSGKFEITGAAGLTVALTAPGVESLTGAGDPMTIEEDGWSYNFEDASVLPTNLGSLTIPAGGKGVLKVGATLNVGASQAAGTYTGDYVLTVNYN